jgi:hypothetical protein
MVEQVGRDFITAALERVWTAAVVSRDFGGHTEALNRHRESTLRHAMAALTADHSALFCLPKELQELHCNHWENGDGSCCACGRPSWRAGGINMEAVEEYHAQCARCPRLLLPDVAEARAAVDVAVGTAYVAMSRWAAANKASLEQCTTVDSAQLLLRYVLTFLISNGLVTAAPPGLWERWLDADLAEPYATDLETLLAAAATNCAGRNPGPG